MPFVLLFASEFLSLSLSLSLPHSLALSLARSLALSHWKVLRVWRLFTTSVIVRPPNFTTIIWIANLSFCAVWVRARPVRVYTRNKICTAAALPFAIVLMLIHYYTGCSQSSLLNNQMPKLLFRVVAGCPAYANFHRRIHRENLFPLRDVVDMPSTAQHTTVRQDTHYTRALIERRMAKVRKIRTEM